MASFKFGRHNTMLYPMHLIYR